MKKSRITVIEILDEARTTSDYGRIEKLLYVYRRGEPENRPAVIQEALIEIANKIRDGEPSFLLAPQLCGILKNCAKRLRSEKARFDARLGETGEEVAGVMAPSRDDPAVLFARLQDMDEKIVLLKKQRAANPRYYVVHVADAQGVPITEHFKEMFGETITPANARKIRERAKLQLRKSLEEFRKDPSS